MIHRDILLQYFIILITAYDFMNVLTNIDDRAGILNSPRECLYDALDNDGITVLIFRGDGE